MGGCVCWLVVLWCWVGCLFGLFPCLVVGCLVWLLLIWLLFVSLFGCCWCSVWLLVVGVFVVVGCSLFGCWLGWGGGIELVFGCCGMVGLLVGLFVGVVLL